MVYGARAGREAHPELEPLARLSPSGTYVLTVERGRKAVTAR